MFYEDVKGLNDGQFKRLTGVKKEVFAQMLDTNCSKLMQQSSIRQHISTNFEVRISIAISNRWVG